ncbi:hypothetical protein [Caballeronia sp. J97]|uniref:hypothetical protein n=1 Tax=Caballeronia sp. J97 TaxID=2805429 RepID=UPI002AB07482|nr:hypothetical protein [Caballeronia sp. J97]
MRLKRTTRAGIIDVGANHFSTNRRKDIAPVFMIHSYYVPSALASTSPSDARDIDAFMQSGRHDPTKATNVPRRDRMQKDRRQGPCEHVGCATGAGVTAPLRDGDALVLARNRSKGQMRGFELDQFGMREYPRKLNFGLPRTAGDCLIVMGARVPRTRFIMQTGNLDSLT